MSSHKKHHNHSCCHASHNCVPDKVKDLLEDGEYISFQGTYDTALRDVSGNISTLPCIIDRNLGGYNIRPAQWYYIKDVQKPTIKFLYENYTITSLDASLNEKVGQISFNGIYKETGSGGITTAGTVQKFTILGADGIYKKVKYVIIDFTNPIRKLFFIKEK